MVMKYRDRDGDYCKLCGSYIPPDHEWYYCSDCGKNPFCCQDCYDKHREKRRSRERQIRGKEQEVSGGIRIDLSNFARDMGKYAGAGAGAGAGARGNVNVNIGGGTITRRSTKVDNKGGLIQRSTIGSGEGRIEICPYCGKDLNFPKPPRFCPYCKEQIRA